MFGLYHGHHHSLSTIPNWQAKLTGLA